MLRALGACAAFWIVLLVAPVSIGGLTRLDAVLIAATALFFVGMVHAVRLAGRTSRTATSGPFAGLGRADTWEVMDSVLKGRAVVDPRLAPPAVEYARQQRRQQSFFRIALPVVFALRALDLILDPPRGAAQIAHTVVTGLPLIGLWILNVVGYRRSQASEDRNLRLT
jgi:hypothetical protein